MYLLNVVPLVYVWDSTVYSAAYGIVTAKVTEVSSGPLLRKK